jgi:NADH-quinone oxidoreductase subunit M
MKAGFEKTMTFIEDSFIGQHVLSLMIALPILGAVVLYVSRDWDGVFIRRWAMGVSLVTLLLTILMCAEVYHIKYHVDAGDVVLGEQHDWLVGEGGGGVAALRLQYKVGVDGISVILLMMTALLMPLAIWESYSGIHTRHREYYTLNLLLLAAMLGMFCAQDVLLFYLFFEFSLIPLYFIIGIWGGPQRVKAANMFFLYSLAGSMLAFAAIMYLGYKASLHGLGPGGAHVFTLDMDVLYKLAAQGLLSTGEQWWLFMALFAAFAVKTPMFPFHTWLPLAHTEAPTAGSVNLASVLLKSGTYGFLRISIPILPDAAIQLAPVFGGLAIIGIIYGALTAWVQSDVKKLVAYSSVSHLGFCLLGMFSMKMAGLTGSLLYMVNHGLSTGALFLVVSMFYARYHTREMSQLGGLARKMPVLAFFLVVFAMSSIGLPGLNGFVSEFLVLLGTVTSGQATPGSPAGPLGLWYAVPAALGILLGAIYMLHMVGRVLFGPLKEGGHGFDESAGLPRDLSRREIAVLAPIAAACLFLGVYPKSVTRLMEPALDAQVLARVVRVEDREWKEAESAESAPRIVAEARP